MNDRSLRWTCLCLALIVAGCQSGDAGHPARLTPSRNVSLLACMLASPGTVRTTSALLVACQTKVPKIESVGLDQVAIEGVLAGISGPADPGIIAACVAGRDAKRAIAGIETMGYGVVMDGQSERVVIVQQDDVTTHHRDGKSESSRIAAASTANGDTAAAPSACEMAIVQALTVASICADQQWTGAGCAVLRSRMKNCGDPTRLMVDPDLGFACQPTVDADAVTSAATEACASRSSGGAACSPQADANGWLRDPGGVCASPGATMSADKETCVVPVSVKGQRGAADITALILWSKAASGGPIFPAEPAKPRG